MRLILDKTLDEKVKGITVASALIEGVTIRQVDEKILAGIEGKLKDIASLRFKDPDTLITSETIVRYQAFFRDVLKLNLINIKPANEVYGSAIFTGLRIESGKLPASLVNYISGAVGLPVFIFDKDKLDGDIILKYASGGEFFNSDTIGDITLEEKDIIFQDDKKPFFLYPYAASKNVQVDSESKNVFISVCGVPGVSGIDLLWSLKLTVKIFNKIFKGKAKPVFQENA
ncbi:MAG: phenylalanine--tRNA ligase beta subunit-related protein [Candidatus Odinarchaeota archaeon]